MLCYTWTIRMHFIWISAIVLAAAKCGCRWALQVIAFDLIKEELVEFLSPSNLFHPNFAPPNMARALSGCKVVLTAGLDIFPDYSRISKWTIQGAKGYEGHVFFCFFYTRHCLRLHPFIKPSVSFCPCVHVELHASHGVSHFCVFPAHWRLLSASVQPVWSLSLSFSLSLCLRLKVDFFYQNVMMVV